MFTISRLSAALQVVCFVLCASGALSQESWQSLPERNEPLRIYRLKLRDDGSMGTYSKNKVEPKNPTVAKLGGLPGYGHVKFVWDGEYLMAHPLGSAPPFVVNKDGWFLTGEYSTDPPSVVLTKEKTKHSKWTFTVGKRLGGYYLTNFNGPKGDAYLALKETGKRTPLAPEWEAIIYDAILTYNAGDKTELDVENLRRNNGK